MTESFELPPAPEPRFRKIFAVTVALLFTVLFVRMIAPFLEAVLLAAVLSGLLYPLFRWIRDRLVNRPAAAILTVLIVFFAVILPLLFLVGAFVREALRLTEMIIPWAEQQLGEEQLQSGLPLWVPFGHQLEPYREQILTRVGELANQAGTFLLGSLSMLTQRTMWFALNLFIMLYTMFFFFLAGPRWLEFFDYTPLTQQDRKLIVDKGVSITRATLKGTVVIGFVQGILGGVAFAVLGVPGALFWGVIMAFASLVPGIGAAIVWIPAAIFLFATGEAGRGLGLLLWGALIVSSVDNILRPRLVGGDTKMPDVLILLSTLGGIAMFGATGIILGPIIAGFFITSWHIFSATFRRELERSESGPALLDGETEGLPAADEDHR